MRNDGQKAMQGGGGTGRSSNGNGGGFPGSFKALSSYLRIVSSGAATVASSVKSAASAASAIVDRELDTSRDQVHWAAFDQLEYEGCFSRQVLLLGYRHGFQVWDVEDVNNVHNVVTKHDGPVSFMQILPKPLVSKQAADKFAADRPLMIICADGGFPGGSSIQESSSCNGTTQFGHELPNGNVVPTVVCFYSFRSNSYVHLLKFRSIIHLVRCSSRVIAVVQPTQIHCFDAATLEMEYNILTNPVPLVCGSGVGFGPVAVGPRWIAYSGSPVDVSDSGRVSPQELTHSASFPGSASNGSLVAHYAKESSKQLATGILTLGDMGYKKLSRYCSELLPDGNNLQSGNAHMNVQGVVNGQSHDAESVGMVIVRDIVERTFITQFRAHKSPISSLCFDPSGTLLVTASVQGHNINVFRILHFGAGSGSHVHLYRLQRGLTNAVIQDISFSRDSEWIMISSSRGTSHLFSISPSGGSGGHPYADSCLGSAGSGCGTLNRMPASSSPNSGNQQSYFGSESPITLSVVSRIRNGNNGWRNAVTGAAVAATGRVHNLSCAVAATFQYCKGNDLYPNTSFLKTNCHLLVFSSPGCLIQYAMRVSSDSMMALQGVGVGYDTSVDCDSRLVIEAMRKWNICQKHNRKEREENIDIYGENGHSDSNKVFPEGMGKKKGVYSEVRNTVTKDKLASEERYHMYISEAELEMHPPQVPLWIKAEMYFHTMVKDGINMDDKASLSGEFEIERIPTRTIEVSSKELVPVFDYLQAPKFQPGRQEVITGSNEGEPLCQLPVASDSEKVTVSGGPGSLGNMTGRGVAVNELHNAVEEEGSHGLEIPTADTSESIVNNAGHPKEIGQLLIVNNRDHFGTETKFDLVNNSTVGLEEENQLEGSSDEFD